MYRQPSKVHSNGSIATPPSCACHCRVPRCPRHAMTPVLSAYHLNECAVGSANGLQCRRQVIRALNFIQARSVLFDTTQHGTDESYW